MHIRLKTIGVISPRLMHIIRRIWTFLKADVRKHFFKTYPAIYSKVGDLPPAKYNPGAVVKNSLVASGSIINGTVENSVLFKKVYVGNNCVDKKFNLF